MYVGERLPGGIAGPPKPFREITEQVTELTPLGRNITVAASLPLVAGSATMPEDQEATEEEALIARNQDEVQAEIDLLTANNKKELENKQRKSEKTKIEKEIKSIEDVISAIQGFDTKKSEAYQEERSRKKRRNTDIFLEEMALSMAGTTNLADGLAIGAANAASKVGDADEVEELARLEANKRAAKLDKDNKISDQDWQDITKRYQESAKLLQKQSTLMGIVDELDLAAASGSVTGINGIIGRLVDDVAGFTGVGGDIVGAATKAVNQGKYLTAQSITEIKEKQEIIWEELE